MWLDVAFDILYVGDTSVIHQSLKERHQLLRKFVKQIPGRLEILVPTGGLNAHRSAGKEIVTVPSVGKDVVVKVKNNKVFKENNFYTFSHIITMKMLISNVSTMV